MVTTSVVYSVTIALTITGITSTMAGTQSAAITEETLLAMGTGNTVEKIAKEGK